MSKQKIKNFEYIMAAESQIYLINIRLQKKNFFFCFLFFVDPKFNKRGKEAREKILMMITFSEFQPIKLSLIHSNIKEWC